ICNDDDYSRYSESSKVATNLCIKLCQEWESIDYPDIDIRYTALIKLTKTICEQCQHYARCTAHKLSENKYFTDLNRTGSFNVSRISRSDVIIFCKYKYKVNSTLEL
ncbi:unnamed protein product, partial [Rotaria sp. Silwood1]